MSEGVRAACVIGWPVRHSRSPLIHNYWIKQYNLDADYRREEIAPETFADFSRICPSAAMSAPTSRSRTRRRRWRCRSRTTARVRSALRTRSGTTAGACCSTNTDVEGFTANLDAAVPGWDKRAGDAVVLGAGGSARGIVYGLIERGIGKIHVVNRTPERAAALQARFGQAVQPANEAALPHLLTRAGLLVNTTSLGMTGQPPLAIDLEPLPRHAVVADLVYAPLGNAVAGGGPRPWPRHRRRARHAAASGGAGVPAVVRGAPGGDRRNCGRWSRQTS